MQLPAFTAIVEYICGDRVLHYLPKVVGNMKLHNIFDKLYLISGEKAHCHSCSLSAVAAELKALWCSGLYVRLSGYLCWMYLWATGDSRQHRLFKRSLHTQRRSNQTATWEEHNQKKCTHAYTYTDRGQSSTLKQLISYLILYRKYEHIILI